jgi:hypothetical protein
MYHAVVPWLLGDPPEEVAGARCAQVLQRLGDGDLDVLLGDLVGCASGSTANRSIIASRQARE